MKDSNFVVVISKKWLEHPIHIKLNEEELAISMKLEDYFTRFIEEFGSPTFVLTKKQFVERVKLTRLAVETAMKDTTKYVV
jgi:hypothetical protein